MEAVVPLSWGALSPTQPVDGRVGKWCEKFSVQWTAEIFTNIIVDLLCFCLLQYYDLIFFQHLILSTYFQPWKCCWPDNSTFVHTVFVMPVPQYTNATTVCCETCWETWYAAQTGSGYLESTELLEACQARWVVIACLVETESSCL